MAYTEYALKQPIFARSSPPQNPDMYEPVTAEKALNDCCIHLLTAIGLGIMYPDRAAQMHTEAGPNGVRHILVHTRQTILKS
jgi:hypothetical protein